MIYNFIHIPKTAGTAILDALKLLESIHIIEDYSDPLDPNLFGVPMIRNLIRKRRLNLNLKLLRNSCSDYIIYGHHNFDRYSSISRRKLITVLRDPIDTLVSYYNYTFSKNTPKKKYLKSSLEEFLLSDFARSFFKIYLNNSKVSSFHFIGFQDDMPSVQLQLSNIFGNSVLIKTVNKTQTIKTSKNQIDGELLLYLQKVHLRSDYKFYWEAKEKFGGGTKLVDTKREK